MTLHCWVSYLRDVKSTFAFGAICGKINVFSTIAFYAGYFSRNGNSAVLLVTNDCGEVRLHTADVN
jgi:hypothetical protein